MPLAWLATGCTQLRTHEGYIVDQTLLDSVVVGIDNRESVASTLGRPTFSGQFGSVNGQQGMIQADQSRDWYYLSRNNSALAFARPVTREQLLVHVQFDALGNVIAIERSGVERVARINPESDETPTLGRNSSFFEELFGNIGTVGAPGAGGQGGGGGSSGG
ncbi:MAG: outer membrane protein assembly factor BamE [Sphingopyxis sp.]